MKAPRKVYNVLFLCAHNSARSVMAECAMRRWANGRFNAYSAGPSPSAGIEPHAQRVLQSYHYKTDDLRSKSWDQFLTPEAPHFAFVFTVCDTLAGPNATPLPTFPGNPMVAHWPMENPSAATGTDDKIMKAYLRAYIELETRCKIFASLRVEKLDRLTLQSSLDLIGTHQDGDRGDASQADGKTDGAA